MLLSLSKKTPWGEPSNFDKKFQGLPGTSGIKGHTIRDDFRWHPGMKIHAWHNSPRASTTDPQRLYMADARSAAYWWTKPWGVLSGYELYRKAELELNRLPWEVSDYKTDLPSWPWPHEIAVPICYATEPIRISFLQETKDRYRIHIGLGDVDKSFNCHTIVARFTLDFPRLISEAYEPLFWLLSTRDGFDHPIDFIRWFFLQSKKGQLDFEGLIIHWRKDTIYDLDAATTLDDFGPGPNSLF